MAKRWKTFAGHLFRGAALRGNPIQSTLVVALLSISQQPGVELATSGLAR